MEKNSKNKLMTSKLYGSGVQFYTKSDGDVTYYACYYDYSNLGKNGKPTRKRIKVGYKDEGITLAYVNTKKNEFATKSRNGQTPNSILANLRKGNITLQEVAEKYYAHRIMKFNLSENDSNIKKDQSIFKTHLQVFAQRDPETIKEEEILELINTKRTIKRIIKGKEYTGYAEATISNIITNLMAILNFALDSRLIQVAPRIKKISIKDNKRERFFSENEIKLIYEHVEDNPILELFVKLSLSTGGRLETIRHVKVKDINLNMNSMYLNDYKNMASGKGNTRYSGFFSNNINQLIQQNIENKTAEDFLFTYPDGQHVSKDYIQNNLQKIFDLLFNSKFDQRDRKNRSVIHTLRHTFASHLAINGVPMYKIQKLMSRC